jgi:hypothetical protein
MNDVYSKYYAPTEHLTEDEVIVLYKGKLNFRQYIPKKQKRFGIKIYKLCDMSRYTYDMDVYFGRNRTRSTADNSDSRDCLALDKKGGGTRT